MNVKKVAVMIYPYFSLQEITCLTSALTLWEEREIDIFASSKSIIKSEDGFSVVANKVFDEFEIDDYDLLILPGIINPINALFDEKNICFLEKLKDKEILIAAISSAPMLLAKAGLLENYKFTSGMFQEMIDYFDFIPNDNVVHVPVCRDKNIITADGFAFREFAAAVLQALGIECSDKIFQGVTREYSEEELTYCMGEEQFKEFLQEWNEYMDKVRIIE
ncbi:DJ-1/PfpI family protein [Lachnospiraceae bacterium OttesenSCG-928-D06]|nr:DJ-1/PfpI family protein [Lachnospiraceae bacterium OttesenSCG-928-D06]